MSPVLVDVATGPGDPVLGGLLDCNGNRTGASLKIWASPVAPRSPVGAPFGHVLGVPRGTKAQPGWFPVGISVACSRPTTRVAAPRCAR